MAVASYLPPDWWLAAMGLLSRVGRRLAASAEGRRLVVARRRALLRDYRTGKIRGQKRIRRDASGLFYSRRS